MSKFASGTMAHEHMMDLGQVQAQTLVLCYWLSKLKYLGSILQLAQSFWKELSQSIW